MRRRLEHLGALALLMAAVPAGGQVLGLPSLPRVVEGLGDVVGATGELVESSVRRLTDLRELRLRELVRRNPRLIDLDDRGAPVVRGELVAIAPTPESLEIARKAGFTLLREERLDELALSIAVLAAPEGMSTRRALKRLEKLDPAGSYEFNHIYSGAGQAQAAALPAVADPAPASGLRIGLVDGGVAADHPALAGARIEQRGFAPGGVVPHAHGTAVASLLAGRSGRFQGAAPGAALIVADVYGSGPTGGSAEAVARALAWMAAKRVAVVNISLVGPPNALLAASVRALSARGQLLVAAVGNDGPAAPPLYPAAYPEVVAVTGVDARRRPLPEAGRGNHVDFAAPGADMAAADDGRGFVSVRGTSFAAPLVAGRLARLLPAPDKARAAAAVDALATEAVDLGPRGPDKQFGRGLVGAALRIPLATLAGR